MSEAGHTGDNVGQSVLSELCFDHGIDLDELSIEVENILRHPSHHQRGDVLSDNGGALSGGGLDGTSRDVAGVVGTAVAQPSLQSYCTHPAQPVRSLVTG